MPTKKILDHLSNDELNTLFRQAYPAIDEMEEFTSKIHTDINGEPFCHIPIEWCSDYNLNKLIEFLESLHNEIEFWRIIKHKFDLTPYTVCIGKECEIHGASAPNICRAIIMALIRKKKVEGYA